MATSHSKHPWLRRILLLAAFLVGAIALVSGLAGYLFGSSSIILAAELLFAGALLLFLFWGSWWLIRKFLWRVGRRLAFSYFLIGVLPIPMVAALTLLLAYLISGFFLGHVYRDTMAALQDDLAATAEALVEGREPTERVPGTERMTALYRDGHRVSGAASLPSLWPEALDGSSYLEIGDGETTLMGSAQRGRHQALVVYSGDLAAELRRRGKIWVDFSRSDDPERKSRVRINWNGREYALQPLLASRGSKERARYFAGQAKTNLLADQPILWWSDVSTALPRLATGDTTEESVTATLNATPRAVARYLHSSSAEVDTAAWAALISAASLLTAIYSIAVAMALFMIFTVSRAVNRLSRATEAVQAGDFSTRIPVRRTDQLGELQRSFNSMAGNLEELVATSAQKEILEKELAIARDLQQSLLPSNLPRSEAVEFSTLFEPSAAIGGDYFDILRVDDTRIAVVIADVSGHGLPTGLRMAMIKAALGILVEEEKEPREILSRLSHMVRSEREDRFFVTATVAVVDFADGTVDLTNAGHPPTYRVRDGEVEEILLPGNPLGALGEDYGNDLLRLEPGDLLVWLSDGLIEIVDPDGEPFGYDGIVEALSGVEASAEIARNRIVQAVEHHAQGLPAQDDQTLVVMRYKAATLSGDSPKNP